MASSPCENGDDSSDLGLQLAAQRTELALDRTQLAWARTVIGLIGAGVALDKGLKLLHEARIISGQAWIRNGHAAGLTITAAGTALLLVVAGNYWSALRKLAEIRNRRPPYMSPALVVSLIVILLGIGIFAVLLADRGA